MLSLFRNVNADYVNLDNYYTYSYDSDVYIYDSLVPIRFSFNHVPTYNEYLEQLSIFINIAKYYSASGLAKIAQFYKHAHHLEFISKTCKELEAFEKYFGKPYSFSTVNCNITYNTAFEALISPWGYKSEVTSAITKLLEKLQEFPSAFKPAIRKSTLRRSPEYGRSKRSIPIDSGFSDSHHHRHKHRIHCPNCVNTKCGEICKNQEALDREIRFYGYYKKPNETLYDLLLHFSTMLNETLYNSCYHIRRFNTHILTADHCELLQHITNKRSKRWDASSVCGWPAVSSFSKLLGGECYSTPSADKLKLNLNKLNEGLGHTTEALVNMEAELSLFSGTALEHYHQIQHINDRLTLLNRDMVETFKSFEDEDRDELFNQYLYNQLFFLNQVLLSMQVHYDHLLSSLTLSTISSSLSTDFDYPDSFITKLDQLNLVTLVSSPSRGISHGLTFTGVTSYNNIINDFELEMLVPVVYKNLLHKGQLYNPVRILNIRGLQIQINDTCYHNSFAGRALCDLTRDLCYDMNMLTSCLKAVNSIYFCHRNLLSNTPPISFKRDVISCDQLSPTYIYPSGVYTPASYLINQYSCTGFQSIKTFSTLPGQFITLSCDYNYAIDGVFGKHTISLCDTFCDTSSIDAYYSKKLDPEKLLFEKQYNTTIVQLPEINFNKELLTSFSTHNFINSLNYTPLSLADNSEVFKDKFNSLSKNVENKIVQTANLVKQLDKSIDEIAFDKQEYFPYWFHIIHALVTLFTVFLAFRKTYTPYKLALASLFFVAMIGNVDARVKFPGNCTVSADIRSCKLGNYDNCTLINNANLCGCNYDNSLTPVEDYGECVSPHFAKSMYDSAKIYYNIPENLIITLCSITISLLCFIIIYLFRVFGFKVLFNRSPVSAISTIKYRKA